MKAGRASNIELMRIVCMLMIVMHHYSVHTVWGELPPGNLFLVRIMRSGAPVAINCFILITGYFGISSSTNVKNKILRLCRDRLFYSVLISFIMLSVGWAVWNVSFLFRTVFPVITCRHNYVTTFIMLYLFIPFLNKFIRALSEKEFKVFVLLMTLVISVLPTCLSLTGLYTNNVYSYLLWMMYIYCLGAFIHLNNEKVKKAKKAWAVFSILCITFIILMETVIEPKSTFLPQSYTSGTRYGMIPLITSISIFCFFLTLQLKPNKVINWVASSTFAVLLIHDDPLVRNVLWSNILKCNSYSSSQYLWMHAFISVILVYSVCCLIDKVYVCCIQRFILLVYQKSDKIIANHKKMGDK